MTRVLLINPPSPEQLGTPLLGFQYVAASLLCRGCEVRVIDAAARHFNHDFKWIIAEAEAFAPQMIGFSLFTRWVWHAYRLVERLRGRFPLLVAGGAHATVCPDEALARGFEIAVIGEAEETIVRLVDWLEGKTAIESICGIRRRGHDAASPGGLPPTFVQDLDALPLPQIAQHLFEPEWYASSGSEVIPGGMLTSRGCPARCTFCANYVTGRSFRYRSPESVVAELNAYHARYGTTFFPFWDDALTANKPRMLDLCEILERDIRFNLGWSAITRAGMITPELLHAMKRAGCLSVNFGVESGDDEILRAIKKGVSTEQVLRALEWAKAEGFFTACNFMLGFPQETPAALERTLRFMERISPLVDTFNTLGVLVPFPGTRLYEDFHERYGFTRWWLRQECSRYSPAPPIGDFDRFYRHYIDDSNLDLDFFHYSHQVRERIRACLKFKAEHNLRKMGLTKAMLFRSAPPGAPAAEITARKRQSTP